jgi:peroxiredoxin
MSRSTFNPGFLARLLVRALSASLALTLLAFAGPRLGSEDIPELPKPDGSSDTPEMIISMINNGAANQPGKIKLSSLRGRVVMIDMFWSQCPHCVEHAPHMAELYNQYKQRGFTVLGLATDKADKIEDVRAFMRQTKINYPIGFITTEVIAYYADSHNHGVPQMILFGPDGKMVKRWIGWTEPISKEVQATIEAQLSKMPTIKPGSKATTRDNQRRVSRA